jgi:glycosyltransferase involved in cell wall biosynthesis
MSTADVTVSYVVTVYNKEPYIGYTTQSLLRQEGSPASEFIFVDDVSKDNSLSVIEDITRGMPNVTIVRNTANCGPSIRLNQGARLARGKYLQFIDSDDIMAANATRVMLSLMDRHDADLVHGSWEKTGITSEKLLGRRMSDTPGIKASDKPLEFVFKERIRRMCQMVRRDTFLAAGGCDERVFIQDESLGLRLARVSKRFVLLDSPVIFIPEIEGELSRNVSQLNHDRYLASYHMICEFPELDKLTRRLLYRRCVSSYWKQQRLMHGSARLLMDPIFRRYVESKWRLMPVDRPWLDDVNAFFLSLPGVLRVPGR